MYRQHLFSELIAESLCPFRDDMISFTDILGWRYAQMFVSTQDNAHGALVLSEHRFDVLHTTRLM